MYLQHLLFLFYPRTDPCGNDTSFSNLTMIEFIVGELFKNKVKLVSANSCVWILSQLGYFSEHVTTLHIIRRENSVLPYFTSFSVNFLKDGWRAKEKKYLIVRTHFCQEKLLGKEQKNENYKQ